MLTAQERTGCLALHGAAGVLCCCMHLPILQLASAGLQIAASHTLCLGLPTAYLRLTYGYLRLTHGYLRRCRCWDCQPLRRP